jgi:hypothetical protein
MLSRLLLPVVMTTCALLPGQDWSSVQSISRDTQVKVRTTSADVSGAFSSASADSIVVRTDSGERAIQRSDVRQVKMRSRSRRIRNGVLGTAIGVGAGIGLGIAICPGCSGEGKPLKFIGPFVAVGVGIGAAAGFGPHAYQTVYKAPKR